jgi:DNA-binding NtrC family response regulator
METKKTILLVDDDSDYLYQKKIELEEEGFKVVTAESKKKAHEALEKNKPDIVIVDLMMENMDTGFVLSYEVKKKYPNIPVIMVTGVTSQTGMYFDSITKEEKEWIKADTIFIKPVRTEQLVGEIKRLIKL